MKAILTYKAMENGREAEKTGLFDTETATKICDVKNDFDRKVQEIYITGKARFSCTPQPAAGN